MKMTKLPWQQLMPETETFEQYLRKSPEPITSLVDLQPRYTNALSLFLHANSPFDILLTHCDESYTSFQLVESLVKELSKEISLPPVTFKGDYVSQGNVYRFDKTIDGLFNATENLVFDTWIEMNSLFGTVYQHNGIVHLQPGRIHQVNGGILMLSANAILSQPLMWFRLLKIIETGQYEWLSNDDNRSLPVCIHPMPMKIKLIIVGDRDNLAELEEMVPDLHQISIYGEIEHSLTLIDETTFVQWQSYLVDIAYKFSGMTIADDAWPVLIRHAARYNEDKLNLPLSPLFWQGYFKEVSLFSDDNICNQIALDTRAEAKLYRESYLLERIYDEFELDQILIDTENHVVGQINGLAVLSYPGHPRAIGEPSRITCIVHLGDGEVNDIERKVELAGNIHAKGLLIMQAFLLSELNLNQQFPLSASIVFEQSYSEVDGDSASLAELCALISAISEVPINQQLAITGSVDQFGNVQPIGGVNEKIEGFFTVCERRGLTGSQGVIIPASNQRHLSLNDEVINAVKEGQFHIWTVEHASEAIELLTSVKYREESSEIDLITLMQKRILQSIDTVDETPWYKRLLRLS
ncbi:Lon protease family protein [Thorsellia anophelis]|uniref:AAA family ATPase n=1 Tax=Thorsellia anophelis TaxID=336804 RepID=UPI0015A64DF6